MYVKVRVVDTETQKKQFLLLKELGIWSRYYLTHTYLQKSASYIIR